MTKAKTIAALAIVPITAETEPVSIASGLAPTRISIIAAAAITVASIELRPSSAQ